MKKRIKFILFILVFITFSCSRNVLINESNRKKESKSLIVEDKINNEIEDLGKNWYKVTATKQIVNITPEKAEQEAINKARIKAIEYSCGIEINSATLNIQSESSFNSLIDYFSQITSLMSQGFILEQKILRNNTKTENGILIKEVTLKVKVGKQKGEKDPYFNINTKLNKEHFTEGEKLQLEITPTKDCYLTIINVYSNETVGLLLPNEHKNNFAKTNETFFFPDENDNFSIPLSLLPNKKEDTEILMIIATKKLHNFTSFDKLSSYNTYESSLKKIMGQLVKIPRNEIEIAFLQYYIHKK
jgi:hypothetical protein